MCTECHFKWRAIGISDINRKETPGRCFVIWQFLDPTGKPTGRRRDCHTQRDYAKRTTFQHLVHSEGNWIAKLPGIECFQWC